MPTYDASGGNIAIGVSTVSWTQAISAAGSPVLFVEAGVGVQPDATITVSSVTALKGGSAQAMTPIGSPVHTNGSNVGFTQLFGMINPDTGTNTILVTCSVSTACLTGISESWTGADQSTGWNSITPATGSSATAGITFTKPATSGVAVFACGGSAFSGTTTGGTFRRNQTGNGSSGAGNSIAASVAVPTGSAQTVSFPLTGSDFWAVVAAEVLPLAAAAAGRSVIVRQAVPRASFY